MNNQKKFYHHLPVMRKECVEGLAIDPKGIYVDLTFGGGGHARAILEVLGPKGRLLAFDQDPDSAAEAGKIRDPRFTFIQANFRFLSQFLAIHEVTAVDGVVADLGVSSYHLDEASRGFANRMEGPLDMRMDRGLPHSAADVIASYSERKLVEVLQKYGEVGNARRLGAMIVRARMIKPIATTQGLKEIAAKCAPRKNVNTYYAKVFQAFRIEVNDEVKALEEMLVQMPRVVRKGGRVVVLAYHSLEDKVVKNFMKSGNIEGRVTHDPYGNVLAPFRSVFRKVVKASEEEVACNNRARSARLRVGERV